MYTTQYTVTVKCCEVHSTQLSIHNSTMAATVNLMVLFFFEVDVVTIRKKVTNKDRNNVHSVLYSNTHTHSTYSRNTFRYYYKKSTIYLA